MQRPHHYTFIEKEKIDDEISGRNPAWWVTHRSYGKESIYSEDSCSPYLLPNEWISSNLAHYLRIPVPPFSVMKLGKNEPPMFTCLRFTPEAISPPDANPRAIWESNQRLCTGIVLFDVLIGNNDRRTKNITVDSPLSPKEIICFDHDCALASDMYGDAKKHFEKKQESFLAENHCLINEVRSAVFFHEWIGRISTIPEWFIREVCSEASTKGFNKKETIAATEFLLWRSKNIDKLIRNNKHEFKGIKFWDVLL